MQSRKTRKNRTNPTLGRHPGCSAGVSTRRAIVPIKATNGNYWKACPRPKCKYQYLWDGGHIKGVADAFCPGCGAPIAWPPVG